MSQIDQHAARVGQNRPNFSFRTSVQCWGALERRGLTSTIENSSMLMFRPTSSAIAAGVGLRSMWAEVPQVCPECLRRACTQSACPECVLQVCALNFVFSCELYPQFRLSSMWKKARGCSCVFELRDHDDSCIINRPRGISFSIRANSMRDHCWRCCAISWCLEAVVEDHLVQGLLPPSAAGIEVRSAGQLGRLAGFSAGGAGGHG